jgi:DHA1 family bicyclomycin/chloramphenicol resistance-like MFS transporter
MTTLNHMNSVDIKLKNPFALIFSVIILEILVGVEMDLVVPSFPELRSVFGLTPFAVELTLGINLLAHTISCLYVGNLGDFLGRRPVIIWGILLFCLGCLVSVYAPNYLILLFGRFLQGAGISAPAVLALIIVADVYSTQDQQKLLGIINGTVTLAIAFAPILGSFICLLFDWKGVFWFLFIFSCLSLYCCHFYMPDSITSHSRLSLSLKDYRGIIQSKKAMSYIFFIGFFTLPYWTFIGISPLLFRQSYGVTLEAFGYFQGSLALVFAGVSLMSPSLLKRFSPKICLVVSGWIIGIFLVCVITALIFDINNPYWITAIMIIFSFGAVFPINITWPYALESIPEAKSRISAALVSIRLLLTMIGVQVVGHFYDGTFLPIGVLCIFSIFVFSYFMYIIIKFDPHFLEPQTLNSKNGNIT